MASKRIHGCQHVIFGNALRRPVTPVTPGLFYDSSGLPAPGMGAGSFRRRLTNTYTGAIIDVRNDSNVVLAIGYDGSNNLDESALLTHCGSGSGYVVRSYKQIGGGADLVMSTAANQLRIVNNGVIDKIGGKPAGYVPDTTARGLISASFTAYTGSDVTLALVGAFANNTPTSGNSNRGISLLPVSGSLGDTDSTGLVGIARNSTTQQWGTNHGGSSGSNWIISAPAEYTRLNSVILCKKGQVYTLNVDGNIVSATETALTNNFNIGRIGLGHTGFAPNTALGTYFAEWHCHSTALDTTQQAQMISNFESYHGTSPIAAITPPTGFDPVASGFTLQAQEDFSTGSYQASEWVIYNNGHMTANAGAWKSSRVVVVQLTDAPYIGQYALEFQTHLNTSVQTLPDGFTYLLEGGAGYWKGPADGIHGAAFQESGLFRATYRWVGKGNAATPSRGHGWADLLWPYNTGSSGAFPENWPYHTEPDVIEVTPGNTNKSGGESNWHCDTVKGSSRHQRQPPTSGTQSQYPGLFTGVPSADVTTQNYGLDWTTWHTVDCVLKPGSYGQIYIDGIDKGKINYTTTPSPYIAGAGNAPDGTPISRAMRRTFQTEGLGVSDSQRQAGTFALQVKLVAYYSLP